MGKKNTSSRRNPTNNRDFMEQVCIFFKRIDTNGNGSLCMEEVRHLYRLMGFEEANVNQETTDLFKQADVNKDGAISLEEFQNYISKFQRLLPTMKQMKKMFEMMQFE